MQIRKKSGKQSPGNALRANPGSAGFDRLKVSIFWKTREIIRPERFQNSVPLKLAPFLLEGEGVFLSEVAFSLTKQSWSPSDTEGVPDELILSQPQSILASAWQALKLLNTLLIVGLTSCLP